MKHTRSPDISKLVNIRHHKSCVMPSLVFFTNNFHSVCLILQTNQWFSSIHAEIFFFLRTQPFSVATTQHNSFFTSKRLNQATRICQESFLLYTFSLRPPALIHHPPVISHKAMGGSRSQAQLGLLADDSLEGRGNRRGFCLPNPPATSAQLPLSLLPSLNLASILVPRLSSSPATYIYFPSTRERNYRPGSGSPVKQPKVGSKHMQRKQQMEQLVDLSHNLVMLPPSFLLFPFSPFSLPGTLGW